MSNAIGKLLYLILFVSIAATSIASNSVLVPETGSYVYNLLDWSFPVTEQIYSTTSLISNTFSYAFLIVIINIINIANKNTEISNSSFDNKLNTTLKNQVLIMEAQTLIVGNLQGVNVTEKEEMSVKLKAQIPIAVKLSNTFVDYKAVDLVTRITNQENFVAVLTQSLAQATSLGDESQAKMINETLMKAQKALLLLNKKNLDA